MKQMFALLIMLAAATASAQVPTIARTVECGGEPARIDHEVIRGESVWLEYHYEQTGVAFGVQSATNVALRYRSSDMATNAFYSLGGTATGAVARFLWAPAYQVAATTLAYNVVLDGNTGANLRAFGTLKQLGSVGGAATNVPTVYLPTPWADAISILNTALTVNASDSTARATASNAQDTADGATGRITVIEARTSLWETAYINSTNWLASVTYGITSGLTNQWTQGYVAGTNWLASAAAGITSGMTNQWTTAYGWGNHAGAGYLLPASTQTIAGASVSGAVGHASAADYSTSAGTAEELVTQFGTNDYILVRPEVGVWRETGGVPSDYYVMFLSRELIGDWSAVGQFSVASNLNVSGNMTNSGSLTVLGGGNVKTNGASTADMSGCPSGAVPLGAKIGAATNADYATSAGTAANSTNLNGLAASAYATGAVFAATGTTPSNINGTIYIPTNAFGGGGASESLTNTTTVAMTNVVAFPHGLSIGGTTITGITQTAWIGFVAYATNGAAVNITGGAYSPLPCVGEEVDTDNLYNVSTKTFTPNTSGVWAVWWVVGAGAPRTTWVNLNTDSGTTMIETASTEKDVRAYNEIILYAGSNYTFSIYPNTTATYDHWRHRMRIGARYIGSVP